MDHLRTALFTFLVIVVSMTAIACNGCSDAEVEDEADTRIDSLAATVPDSADAVMIVPEISELPEAFDQLTDRYDNLVPASDNIADELVLEFGVQIADPEFLELAGFALDGSLTLAIVDGRPVLSTYVADDNAFERYVTGHVQREMDTQTRPRDETHGGQEFYISGDGRFDDMAWYYDGARVVLVMPVYEKFEDYISNTAEDVATQLGELEPEDSLAEDADFDAFRDRIGDDYPVSLYIPPQRLGDDEDGLARDLTTMVKQLSAHSADAADGVGFGLQSDPERVDIDTFLDADDDRLADAVDDGVDPGALVTDETVLASTLALSFDDALDRYLDDAGDADEIRDRFDVAADSFSEQALITGSDFGGRAETSLGDALFGTTTTEMLSEADTDMIATYRITDPDTLDGLGETAANDDGEQDDDDAGEEGDHDTERLVERRALVVDGDETEDATIVEPSDENDFPVRVVIYDDIAALVGADVDEGAVYEFITADTDATLLAETDDAELGQQFLEAESAGALYVAPSRIDDTSVMDDYRDAAEALDEALIMATDGDSGLQLETTFQFTHSLAPQ